MLDKKLKAKKTGTLQFIRTEFYSRIPSKVDRAAAFVRLDVERDESLARCGMKIRPAWQSVRITLNINIDGPDSVVILVLVINDVRQHHLHKQKVYLLQFFQ